MDKSVHDESQNPCRDKVPLFAHSADKKPIDLLLCLTRETVGALAAVHWNRYSSYRNGYRLDQKWNYVYRIGCIPSRKK